MNDMTRVKIPMTEVRAVKMARMKGALRTTGDVIAFILSEGMKNPGGFVLPARFEQPPKVVV